MQEPSIHVSGPTRSNVLTFDRFCPFRIACKGIEFLFASQYAFTCTILSSTSVLLLMIDEEEWGYLNDWEPDQLRKKRTKICMCCDHFRYACTVQCVTLLTCPVHQKLIPQGDHLIKGCKYWVKRRELREGWCPEVA